MLTAEGGSIVYSPDVSVYNLNKAGNLKSHDYFEASLADPISVQKRLIILNKDENLLNNEMYLWNKHDPKKAQISAVKCDEYILPLPKE
jgi:hypothetical protein